MWMVQPNLIIKGTEILSIVISGVFHPITSRAKNI
jgi:hypothetical protein